MENRSMVWHRVYPVLLFVFAALGVGRLWYWLSDIARESVFPYAVLYGRGTVLFCVLLVLAELVLCIATAVQLRAMEPGGWHCNRVLLWGLLPISLFVQSLIVYGWAALLTLGLFYFVISLPIALYYEKRKELFLPEDAPKTA